MQKFSQELAAQRALLLGESSSSRATKKKKKKEVFARNYQGISMYLV